MLESDSVALVHDYLLTERGAERTFAHIADCWPQAPIFTLVHDPAGVSSRFKHRDVRTSVLQSLGVRQSNFRPLLPLYPRAVESLKVRDYKVVVSSSSAFAHGVRPRAAATHVCYCYTPFRYAWHDYGMAVREAPRLLRPQLRRTLKRIRDWDIRAAQRTTHYIAASQLTQQRIAECWGRDAAVVHPPVDVERFHFGEPEDYFLVVSELVRHKRVEVALEAAKQARRRVRVVGTGPDRRRLEGLYGGTAEFLGRVREEDLVNLYARSRALVVPNIEEFGIAAVEAQAAGRPVVAANAGGVTETVIDGVTGILVRPESVGAFAEVLRYTDFDRFSPVTANLNAMRFTVHEFQRRFLTELKSLGVLGALAPDEPPDRGAQTDGVVAH